jgi:hypothetical protein
VTNVIFIKVKLHIGSLIPISREQEQFMQQLICLNDLYRQYSLRVLEKKKLEEAIFKSAIDTYDKYRPYDWDRDEYIEYLCWLYPRLNRAIDNYKETGASFESYINAMIHWSAKEYRFRLADHYTTEYAAWLLHSEEMQVRDIEPAYGESETKPAARPPSNPRQMMILILKCYYFVSDDFLERIAPQMGLEKEFICRMIDKLRVIRVKREENIFHLRERIHCQFYRCITYEKRLLAASEDTAHYAKMKSRIERARSRLSAMRKRLASTKLEPTNRQIGDILGISKGAVDAGFHALKNRHINSEQDILDTINLN